MAVKCFMLKDRVYIGKNSIHIPIGATGKVVERLSPIPNDDDDGYFLFCHRELDLISRKQNGSRVK